MHLEFGEITNQEESLFTFFGRAIVWFWRGYFLCFNMEGCQMWFWGLFKRLCQWLRGWKFRLPDVDSSCWQNKDEILNDLKSHYW